MILGILLVVGSLTLFKTFAFFEEKREFNVLKGRVPEFSHEDIQLAFTINGEKGEKFPTNEEGLVAKNVTCSNGATASWSNSLWALTNVNSNGNKKVYCSIEFVTGFSLYENLKIGDYVSYTPLLDKYEIASELSGYEEKQIINPKELNLWRIIKKNENGTIELVSQYSTSNNVWFVGKKGYMNYVGILNGIASSYETTGITSASRAMGYDGQTEFIKDLDVFNCSTSSTCNLIESRGGGDQLYISDVDLVRNALGTLSTFKYGSEISQYVLASRFFRYDNENDYGYAFSTVVGNEIELDGKGVYNYFNGYREMKGGFSIRPVITLKSGIIVSNGDGTPTNPWKVN